MYFVYILKSIKDGSYYIGYTEKPIEDRLREHNQGKCKYTKGHTPYTITKYITLNTKKEAKNKEKYFKSLKKPGKVIEIMGSPDSMNRD
jgi:putative endonuclease